MSYSKGSSYEDTKIETFDDFNQSESGIDSSQIVPFQFNKELTTHQWLKNFFDVSRDRSLSRMRHYKRNWYLYKGVHWKGEGSSKRAPKQVVNFINEMVDAKVSSRARNKVSFQVIPNEYGQTAINAAKGIKKLLKSRMNQIGFDQLNRELDQIMFVMGHAFFYPHWDDCAGGIHPLYKKIKELDLKAAKKVQKKLGSDAFLGDACIDILGANRVFPEMDKEKGIGQDGDVDYVDIVKMVNVEQLRAEYPNHKIDPDSSEQFFWRINDESPKSEYCVKHTFYHRPTKFHCGTKIVWCDSAVLEETPFPYRNGILPLIESRDNKIYEEYFGRSDIENTYGLQRFYNAIQSFQARDVSLASAPKWVIPEGSVKPSNVNNEFSVMQYKGAIEPKLVTYKPTPDQGFVIQDRLENKIAKSMRAFDMSRGQVPKGITATSALRLMEDQEQNVSLNGLANRRKRIISTLNYVADIMAQYYKKDEPRTISMLGEKNEYMFDSISKIDFTKFDRVEIEKTSALSESKAGRISDIVELNQVTQTDPVFKKPEIIEILGLGLDSAYRDRATIEINAARLVLEKISNREHVPEPQKYDGLIVQRGILIDALKESIYTGLLDQDTLNVIRQRILVIEALMDERCRENLKFAQECAILDDFPTFFKMHMNLGDIIRLHMNGGSFENQTPEPQETEHISIDKEEELQL